MEDKISKFVDWFKSFQKEDLAVAPTRFEDCGYGLKALRDIEAGECILTIPKSIILSIDCAYNDKTFEELVISKVGALSVRAIFAAYIWYERAKGESSSWYSYFQILPTQFNTLCSWNEAELETLERKELINKINEKKSTLQKEFSVLNHLSTKVNEHPAYEFLSTKTFEDYLNVVSLIETRTIFYESIHDKRAEIGAFLPLFDYANHSLIAPGNTDSAGKEAADSKEESKTKESPIDLQNLSLQKLFYYDTKQQKYMMKAFRKFNKDSQVFIIYCLDRDNFHFLEFYGFLPSYNPYNCVKFNIGSEEAEILKKVASKGSGENFQAKLKLVQSGLPHLITIVNSDDRKFMKSMGFKKLKEPELGLVADIELSIQASTGEPTWEFIMLLKTLTLEEIPKEDFDLYSLDGDSFVDSKHRSNFKAAVNAIHERLRAFYNKTEEENLKAIEQITKIENKTTSEERCLMGNQYALSEKQAIQKFYAYLCKLGE